MNLKFVSNKMKFIDLDARRPRLMNLETAIELLAQLGNLHPHEEIKRIMENPIQLEKPRSKPKHYELLDKYSVMADKDYFYVEGVRQHLLDAAQHLLRRGLMYADALRVLALAVDLYEEKL